eukprot:GFUD01087270.1.p1 GENE.GFUD01087270.1~~GFUD01087270.1.p1  ORF type:complete len:118 (+),score=20.62 GFUD01087270.1:117-470(+)
MSFLIMLPSRFLPVLARNCPNQVRNVHQCHSVARTVGLARSDLVGGARSISTGRICHVINKSGLIRPEPATEPLHLGLVKILLTVFLGLYIGTSFSMKMVAFLEEYNIFVPDDEDDD